MHTAWNIHANFRCVWFAFWFDKNSYCSFTRTNIQTYEVLFDSKTSLVSFKFPFFVLLICANVEKLVKNKNRIFIVDSLIFCCQYTNFFSCSEGLNNMLVLEENPHSSFWHLMTKSIRKKLNHSSGLIH